MEIVAKSQSNRISSRKVMLVADVIRKKSATDALNTLSITQRRGAYVLSKALKSAIANALNKKQNKDALFIKRIEVTQGPFLKRYHASTRGRVHPYKRRSSNIKIVLEEKGERNKILNSKKFRI